MPKLKRARPPMHPKNAKSRKGDKHLKVFEQDDVLVSAPGNMQSPIDELRDMPTALSDLGGNYRGQLNSKLARVYAIALCLLDDLDLWQDFCLLPEWGGFKGKKPEIDKPNDVLQPCIRLAVGFNDKNASKTASKYFNALSVPFEEQVPSADVPAYIEHHGGIEELAKRAAKLRREGKAEPDDESLFRLVMPTSEIVERLVGLPPDKQFKATLMIAGPDSRGMHQIEIVQVKAKE